MSTLQLISMLFLTTGAPAAWWTNAPSPEPCSGAEPVLDYSFPANMAEPGHASFHLPSRYNGNLVLTPVTLTLEWPHETPGTWVWNGKLTFPNQPNLFYTLYRIEISLESTGQTFRDDYDFSDGCEDMGHSLRPGDTYRLFSRALPPLEMREHIMVRVRVWGH